jgi:hypothetical protein
MQCSKLFPFVLFAAASAFCQDGQSVYILKMGSGFDQYLANNLTNQKQMRVVTDPQLADFILTDKLGEAFQAKLEELYPPEKPIVVVKKDADKKDAEPEKKEPQPQPRMITNMGGGKGTIFLVDRKSKTVTWSTFFTPKNSSPTELNRSARKVVEEMKSGGGKKS